VTNIQLLLDGAEGDGRAVIEVLTAPKERKEELWQLFLEYAQELSTFDGETRPHTRRHYAYFDSYWEGDLRTPYVILYDHELIGFCLLDDTGISYRIDEFYIRPLHRRRGFGMRVVEHVKERCRERGRHSVLAADIYINNVPALEFWKSAGFKDTGRRLRIKELRMIETEIEL
jgi:predicted acetyltransferase